MSFFSATVKNPTAIQATGMTCVQEKHNGRPDCRPEANG